MMTTVYETDMDENEMQGGEYGTIICMIAQEQGVKIGEHREVKYTYNGSGIAAELCTVQASKGGPFSKSTGKNRFFI